MGEGRIVMVFCSVLLDCSSFKKNMISIKIMAIVMGYSVD